MSLVSGDRLGPYTVLERLGAGGMGEVYRATDTRLGRTVAIKVLAGLLSAHPDARERFRREARTLSLLAHPHICALYDVGEQDAADYLVMEMIEGETLSERLRRGPLALADVRALGSDIAAALAHAHRSGIAHRDLKPGNIMVTGSGAKLLDFGLAKLVATEAVAPDNSTVRQDLTATGAVLGTLQYMSPEQIEGRAADFRSDIFSLGAVLFEMVTGRRAFEGQSAAAAAAAIVSVDPPPVGTLRPDAPPAFDAIVRGCLAKNPEHRWQSAHDVSAMLRGISEHANAATPAGPAATPGVRRALPWVVAAGALLIAAAAWLRHPPPTPVSSSEIAFAVPPPPGAQFMSWVEANELAMSPDGTRLAFIGGTSGVFLRPVGSLTATPLAGTERANGMFWSPDGGSIAFFRDGQLSRIDAKGGAAVQLCDISRGTGYGGSWGTDGIVFGSISGQALMRVATSGGTPIRFVSPDPARHEIRVLWPHFLPDGRRFLYVAWHDDRTARVMLWEPDATPREIMTAMSNVEFVEPGYLLFVRDGTLLARRFDVATATLSGDTVAVAQPVDYALIPGIGHFSSSRNGVVALQPHSDVSHVSWFDRSAHETARVMPPGKYQNLRISPDGRQLVADRTAAGNGTYDLWTLDIERGVETRQTSDAGNEIHGAWTRDGRSFVYSAGPFGPPELVVRDLATGKERTPRPGGGLQVVEDFAPDGRLLFAERAAAVGNYRLFVMRPDGTEAAPLLDDHFNYASARFSPDGKWLAYVSDEPGTFEVTLVRWPVSQDKLRVSTGGGSRPRWSRDGRELFYLAPSGLMRVPFVADRPGQPAVLIEPRISERWSDFDVAPDGRFAAIVSESIGARQPLTVIVNWPSRVP